MGPSRPCASTRWPPTPAPTSAACGRRAAPCCPRRRSPTRPPPAGSRSRWRRRSRSCRTLHTSASYYAPNGHYAATDNYFYPKPAPGPLGGGAYDNAPLHAVPNNTSANGVYSYGGNLFPTSSYQASNYWVDVVFAPAAAPGPATNVSATAGRGQATVTWSAPSSGGPPTTYTVTPYIGSVAQPSTTVTGSPPVTTVDHPQPERRIHLHVHGHRVKPQRLRGGIGAVQCGHTDRIDGRVPPPRTSRRPRPPDRPWSPGLPPRQRRELADRLHHHALRRLDGPGAGAGIRPVGDVDDHHGTDQRNRLHVHGHGQQRSRSERSVGAVQRAVTPEDTIFDFATPTTVDSGDGNGVSLGVKFTADAAGSVDRGALLQGGRQHRHAHR